MGPHLVEATIIIDKVTNSLITIIAFHYWYKVKIYSLVEFL